MDGLEPPWKVLQTRASPLGHMTSLQAQRKGIFISLQKRWTINFLRFSAGRVSGRVAHLGSGSLNYVKQGGSMAEWLSLCALLRE